MRCHCCDTKLPKNLGDILEKGIDIAFPCKCGTFYKIESNGDPMESSKFWVMISSSENSMKEFLYWRDQIDSEHALDVFDLALGWFAGRGFSHDYALKQAKSFVRGGEEEK